LDESDTKFEIGKTTLIVVADTPRVLVEACSTLTPLGNKPAIGCGAVVLGEFGEVEPPCAVVVGGLLDDEVPAATP
jgi:hypothetical protein